MLLGLNPKAHQCAFTNSDNCTQLIFLLNYPPTNLPLCLHFIKLTFQCRRMYETTVYNDVLHTALTNKIWLKRLTCLREHKQITNTSFAKSHANYSLKTWSSCSSSPPTSRWPGRGCKCLRNFPRSYTAEGGSW